MGVVCDDIFGNEHHVIADPDGGVVEVGTPRYFKIREEQVDAEATVVAELAEAVATQVNAAGTVSAEALEQKQKNLQRLADAFRGDFEESDTVKKDSGSSNHN